MNKDAFNNQFWGETLKVWKDGKLPWLDTELFLSSYRRNMNLLNTTQQIAAETTKAVLQLQAEYVKDVFEQMSEQAKKNITTFSPEERISHQSQTTKQTFDQALEHARHVNELISKSNEKIMENVQKRFKEGLDESATFTKAKSTTKSK